jgi:hypothetical protein
MKSFILSLLPGLEEETGEFFEKVSFFHWSIKDSLRQCYVIRLWGYLIDSLGL